MSIDTKNDTITVNDVAYDVERDPLHEGGDMLTIEEFPGLEGRISYEQDVHPDDNPRSWSNIGTMAVSYRGYDLGDEDIEKIDFEVECNECEDGVVTGLAEIPGGEDTCATCNGTGYKMLDPVTYFKQERGARVVLGLTVYEHSGITMRAGDVTLPWDTDRWDTSFVGFIFDTPEALKECMGDDVADEDIEKALRSEVEIYASYLEGDVTWWSVSDDETGFNEACGGYVGDSDHCEEECFRAMESAIEKRLAEQQERSEWAARDTVTI